MLKKCKEHLECAEEGYFQHFAFATKFSLRLVFAGVAGVTHAIIPAFFKTTASDTVLKLAEELKERRARTDANLRKKIECDKPHA